MSTIFFFLLTFVNWEIEMKTGELKIYLQLSNILLVAHQWSLNYVQAFIDLSRCVKRFDDEEANDRTRCYP